MTQSIIGSKYYETLNSRVNQIISTEELPEKFSTIRVKLKYKNWRCYSSLCNHALIKPEDMVYSVTPDDPSVSSLLHASCVRGKQ